MNLRNVNAAGKPETIRTTLEKLREASARCCRICRNRHRDDAFLSHIQCFANSNVCYASVNGISIPVPLGCGT